MEQYGREPGEPWHGLADEMSKRYAALQKRTQELKGKSSLPYAERLAAYQAVDDALFHLNGIRERLLEDIPASCPSTETVKPADEKSEGLWLSYDRLAKRSGMKRFERSRIQRMIRRAHGPAAILELMADPHNGDRFGVWAELFRGIEKLLKTTPLPRLGDRSIMQAEQEARRQAVCKGRDPARREALFDDFVNAAQSADLRKRQAARRAMRKFKAKARDERNGPMTDPEMPENRRMIRVWDGVRAALDHIDPFYRRAALSSLPMLEFGLIFSDFSDEAVAFVLKGLQDPDARSRYKVMQFGQFFYKDALLNMPRLAADFERKMRELRRRLARSKPQAAKTIGKLIKNIDLFSQDYRRWVLERSSRETALRG